MKQQVTNFRRFYGAIKALDFVTDRDDVKKSLVHQYTNGRTDSLREMTRAEYDRCCEDLERKAGRQGELRKERSKTLKLMQQMGVDTTDWRRVNLLCRDTRIIGKDFYMSPSRNTGNCAENFAASSAKAAYAVSRWRCRSGRTGSQGSM